MSNRLTINFSSEKSIFVPKINIEKVWNDRSELETMIISRLQALMVNVGDYLIYKLYMMQLLVNLKLTISGTDDLLSYAYYYLEPDSKEITEWNDMIIPQFKDISPIYNGYTIFSFSIIKNPNNTSTLHLVNYLLKYNYRITDNDINMVRCIKYKYINEIIVKYIAFFICYNLIKDIKYEICVILSQLILWDIAPIFSKTAYNILNYKR